MYEIKMPRFGLTMEKGYIERWLKREGDLVNKGDSLLEASSDKISNEISSPVSGFLIKILGIEGEEYPVGHIIGIIGEENEQYQPDKKEQIVSKSTPSSLSGREEESKKATDKITEQTSLRIKASPLAKRLAKEHNINLSTISGTGPEGRIIRNDILLKLDKGQGEDFIIKKLSGLRKTIIERLSQSHQEAITLTNMTEVDFTQLKNLTKSNNIGITAALVYLVCKVLLSLKQFNSHFEKNYIKEYNVANIGLAVDTERGLIVPVLKNVQNLTVKKIQEQIKSLTDQARSGLLNGDNLKGSTFTITNLGMMRTDFFTPVLNPPEVAILGIGRIIKKVCVVEEDKITIREMAYLSLSYDHRVIDGADAARFLDKLAHYIEKPEID